jgi:hypothetical protein
MSALPHWIYALAAFYLVLGVIIFRMARRPSCRVCALRYRCPNRLAGIGEKPHCVGISPEKSPSPATPDSSPCSQPGSECA